MSISIGSQQLLPELEFTASRSSGAGGQNVNKVNSKVTLRWNVARSTLVTEERRDLLLTKLAHQLTQQGELILSSQEHRSQLQNRDEVLRKLDTVLQQAFKKRKVRRASKPSKAAAKKRLESKKRHSEKKQWRKRL